MSVSTQPAAISLGFPGGVFLRGAAVLLAGLLAAVLPGEAQVAPAGGYRIGPKDLLEIRVFEVPELNIERRVSEEGTVNLPLIGDVPVQGLTDSELAERLKALLEARYVQRASVAVQVREFRSRPITMMGSVRQPGNLAFSGRWTLMEALGAAGGLTERHGGTIFVMRRAENGLTDQIAIEVDDLMLRALPEANIPIFSGDVINIPGRVEVTVHCLGQVARPGALTFTSTQRISLLTAIAQAGGVTNRASRTVQIQRRDRSGQDVILEVDYRRILAGREPDPELRDGDVIVVRESFF